MKKIIFLVGIAILFSCKSQTEKESDTTTIQANRTWIETLKENNYLKQQNAISEGKKTTEEVDSENMVNITIWGEISSIESDFENSLVKKKNDVEDAIEMNKIVMQNIQTKIQEMYVKDSQIENYYKIKKRLIRKK